MPGMPLPAKALSRRDALLGAAAALLAWGDSRAASSDPAGTPIEWSPLRMLDGSQVKEKDWQGLPVVVVFWATWCPYCKRHNAHVEQLFQASAGKKLRVLGVSTETDQAKVQAYMRANQFHFPVALADNSFRAQFSDRRVVPLTCLVSAKGRLVQAVPGEWSQDDVMALAAAAWA
jgi:thiol-disulfide isomerase/thioredoxin